MNIVDYIKKVGMDKVIESKISNPYQLIEESDDLPYDRIGIDDSGVLTKLIEIDDERVISIYDLISYSSVDEIEASDKELREVYEIYMTQIDLKDPKIADIQSMARDYMNFLRSKK